MTPLPLFISILIGFFALVCVAVSFCVAGAARDSWCDFRVSVGWERLVDAAFVIFLSGYTALLWMIAGALVWELCR